IIIRIRDLARHPDLSILEFVREFSEKDLVVTRNLTGFFEHYLETGKVLILLDGLDEVADLTQRYKVVDKIEAFLNQCGECRTIITSRPAGYKRDFFRTDEFPHYELQPFDDEKIDTFIEHWYNSLFELESERERRKSSLRKAFGSQSRIKQLARNPLLLTIIALIHRYQAQLPKERFKLYDKAVETLLTTWDSNKELSNHEILEYLELDDLRRLMERLAYWIHCQGGTGDTEGGTLIDREELISQLTLYIREMKRVERHEAKAEAKRFLELIVRDRAGLLSLQGQDRYAFVHKTFQEYLTAMEIRDQQEDGFEVVIEHVEQYLHNAHWEEVLLLLIAQQKRKNPAKILRCVLEHNSPYERWLHRDLLF
ncbi:MAG: NACHT domain-containing protein, partial [Cyanobacteria bacterium J06649_4]